MPCCCLTELNAKPTSQLHIISYGIHHAVGASLLRCVDTGRPPREREGGAAGVWHDFLCTLAGA